MARSKETVFFCQNCGFESAKWLGQCPGCREWNTMTEEPAPGKEKNKQKQHTAGTGRVKPVTLDEIENDERQRIPSGIEELDRVLGNGIVRGSLVLVGGDPGIGKSTLLLQLCRNLSNDGHKLLYVSGEESASQIKMRARRLGNFGTSLSILCDTDLDDISDVIEKENPEVVVIDSIQTMINENVSSSAGSVSQVRESTGVLMRIAKQLDITVFIVGHVTKEGAVAGPKVLEHMVDTVLYFEGDIRGNYRLLRAVKNRFGSTDEIGVFEMYADGLRQVSNPSEYMLSGRAVKASGNVVTCVMEGTRPLLIEIQALVCDTSFGLPRRQTTGIDYNRLNLLMAVLEKRVGLRLAQSDAYVNIAGGLKVNEPATDLALIMAVVSSFRNQPIDEKTAAFGEVGLGGEVRAVSMCDKRINEAKKLGFSRVIIPKANHKNAVGIEGIEIAEIGAAEEVLDIM